MIRLRSLFVLSAVLAGTVCALSAQAQIAAATYLFNDTFAAQEAGKPALTPVDPNSTSLFETDTVFGQSRRVWHFIGNATPVNEQAGLTLNTTGLVTPDNYSAEMVFELSDRDSAWRRLLDVQNRASDNGFYVDPNNNLDIFPVSGGGGLFTTGVYHHVVLTDSSSNTVNAYLDGTLAFSTTTTIMHLNSDLTDNPNALLNFFLDNTVGGGQGEYSSGKIALARLYDSVLTDQQVAILAADPFGTAAATTPEPGSLALLAGLGLPGVLLARRLRRACKAA